MKSTGEVMGTDQTFAKALYKAFAGAKMAVPDVGSVLLTIDGKDKEQILPLARRFRNIGYQIFATAGTSEFLRDNGVHVTPVTKIHENNADQTNILRLLEANQVQLVINTMGHDHEVTSDGFVIRQTAIEHNIPLITSLNTAEALLTALEGRSFTTQSL